MCNQKANTVQRSGLEMLQMFLTVTMQNNDASTSETTLERTKNIMCAVNATYLGTSQITTTTQLQILGCSHPLPLY